MKSLLLSFFVAFPMFAAAMPTGTVPLKIQEAVFVAVEKMATRDWEGNSRFVLKKSAVKDYEFVDIETAAQCDFVVQATAALPGSYGSSSSLYNLVACVNTTPKGDYVADLLDWYLDSAE